MGPRQLANHPDRNADPARSRFEVTQDLLLVHTENVLAMLLHFKSNFAKSVSAAYLLSEGMTGLEEDTALVRAICQYANKSPSGVAKAAGLAATTITRPFNGEATSRISLPTLEKLRVAFPGFDWPRQQPDIPPASPLQAYVEVEVLPTYAGMGGGGTGDGDRQTTLLPRSLVEDDLRVSPADLLVIDLRGDSMEPDFFNGDRVVVNRRDTNPVQPGPFALWDGDGYVVKNIERRRGSLRIFSSNPKYSEWESDGSDVQIMGRPVWVARRL